MKEPDYLSKNFRFISVFVLILWVAKLLELQLSADWHYLGIYPRTLYGTLGILTGPLVHGDIFHLLSNSVPLLVLGGLLFLVYRRHAIEIFALIYLITGIMVWIVARQAYHIGASGLVYGLFGYIFFSGFLNRQRNLIIVSLAILLLYGGIFHGLFPGEASISWESHLVGMITGAILAFLYKDDKPKDSRDEGSEDQINHTGPSDSTVNYQWKPR